MALAGKYLWSYASGAFTVQLRPSGVFYCPKYTSGSARWEAEGEGRVKIDWGSYGNYVLDLGADGEFTGASVSNPASWRKMRKDADFSPSETLLMGEGGGSVWDFAWEKGSFEVEFRCDGLNHFVCPSFPAHSHWTLEEEEGGRTKVNIAWDKYGDYELVIDAESRSMAGSKKGQPENWRRATFLRPLSVATLSDAPAHDHAHAHVHTEHCKH